jgi:iron complex outermembrane receptor protein
VDYTDYLFVGQYLPYYICDGSVTYPGAAAPSGVCQEPNLYVASTPRPRCRATSSASTPRRTSRFRVTAGVFYSDLELEERNDFTYPGHLDADPFGPFAPNFPFDTGYVSDPGPFPADVIFRNDVLRTDEQLGVFGEATYELVPDTFAVTVGARWYDIEVDLEGSANASFFNSGAARRRTRSAPISRTCITATVSTPSGARDTSRRPPITTTRPWPTFIADRRAPRLRRSRSSTPCARRTWRRPTARSSS